jgi:hypothetical protein
MLKILFYFLFGDDVNTREDDETLFYYWRKPTQKELPRTVHFLHSRDRQQANGGSVCCAILTVRKKETDEQFLWLFYDTDLVVGQKNAVSEPFVLFFWNCVSKMRPMRDRKRVKNINSCRPLIKRDESKCNFDHRWKTLLNVLILSAVSFEKTGQASQQCTCECRILSIPCFSSTTEGLLFV